MIKKVSSIGIAAMLAISMTTVAAFSVAAEEADSDKITVKATSNFFPETTQTYDSVSDKVTVTYYLSASLDIVNTQWKLTYDADVLTPVYTSAKKVSPNIKSGGMTNHIGNQISYCCSAVEDIDKNANFSSNENNIFATFEFTINEGVELGAKTVVDLDVSNLTLAASAQLEDDPDTTRIIVESTQYVINNNVVSSDETLDSLNISKDTEVVVPEITTEPTTSVATEEPTTVAPTEPTTEASEPTTVAPTEPLSEFNIVAKSNLFSTSDAVNAKNDDKITVNYYFDSEKDILNAQWVLSYNPAVLELTKKSDFMPYAENGALYSVKPANGKIRGVASNLELYKLGESKLFLTAEFKVLDSTKGDTEVNLDVDVLTISSVDADTNSTKAENEEFVVNHSVIEKEDGYRAYSNVNLYVVPTEPTTAEPTTVAPTTAVEPTTTGVKPTEPETTAPATEATDATEVTKEPVQPTTQNATTVAPTEVTTTATTATQQDQTSATGTTADKTTSSTTVATTAKATSATSSTSKTNTTTNNSSAVQTGSTPLATVILSVLAASAGVLAVLRKKNEE